MRAKSVIERDLALIRERRAERERAAGVMKARSSSDAKKEKQLSKDSVTGHIKVDNDMDTGKSEDVEPSAMEGIQEPHAHDPNIARPTKASYTMAQNNLESTYEPNVLPETIDAISTATTQGALPNTQRDTREIATVPEQSSTIPATGDLEDATFESILDTTNTGDTDFDLDFSIDANISQEMLDDNSFNVLNNDAVDIGNLNSTSNEDINTLLPGLENYVNAGEDFSMIDVLPTTTSFENPAMVPQATSMEIGPTAAQGPSDAALIESSFDDMYDPGEFTTGGTGDLDIGDENVGDLGDWDDNDWFPTT